MCSSVRIDKYHGEMERNSFPVQIQALTAADASACDAIIRSLPCHFGDQNGVRAAARTVRSSRGLVALLDDAVVGFLTIQPHFEASAEIAWMAVHARHRGQGVGSALIEQAKRDVTEEGRESCW